MNKAEINKQIEWQEIYIEDNKNALRKYAKEMRLYKACVLVATIMGLGIIPVSYAFFGEDGLMLGMFIMIIASACAFANLMHIDNVKDLMNQTKYAIKVHMTNIEWLNKYGFLPLGQ